MATKAEVAAAHDLLVANSAKFDAWLNGAAGATVELGEATVPTLASIVADLEDAFLPSDPANGYAFAENEDTKNDFALWDQGTETFRRVRLENGALVVLDPA
jgi:hypothetical protein